MAPKPKKLMQDRHGNKNKVKEGQERRIEFERTKAKTMIGDYERTDLIIFFTRLNPEQIVSVIASFKPEERIEALKLVPGDKKEVVIKLIKANVDQK